MMSELTPKNLKKLNLKRGLKLFLKHDDMNVARALRILNYEAKLKKLQEELIKLQALVLMVFVARYLTKIHDKEVSFKASIIPLWIPIFSVLILILPANLSTAFIIFSMLMVLAFLGGYPLKYLGAVAGLGIVLFIFFILIAKAFPEAMPNRVDTWTSRIENFMDNEDTAEDYQIEKAKIAIASGSLYGLGPGKSVQKNFLPQSSSDFIFAVIIEEYGLLGGLFLLTLYLLLLFRIVIVAQKADSVFGKLLSIGAGRFIKHHGYFQFMLANNTYCLQLYANA